MVKCKICNFQSKTGNIINDIQIVVAHTIKEHPEIQEIIKEASQ